VRRGKGEKRKKSFSGVRKKEYGNDSSFGDEQVPLKERGIERNVPQGGTLKKAHRLGGEDHLGTSLIL